MDEVDDQDPIGLKDAIRHAKLAALLKLWHVELAGGPTGSVALVKWKSKMPMNTTNPFVTKMMNLFANF